MGLLEIKDTDFVYDESGSVNDDPVMLMDAGGDPVPRCAVCLQQLCLPWGVYWNARNATRLIFSPIVKKDSPYKLWGVVETKRKETRPNPWRARLLFSKGNEVAYSAMHVTAHVRYLVDGH